MGRWLSPYGHPVPTPHFDRFAKAALLFRRAFCAAPTCSPSRAALLTGMTAHQAGMLGLAHRGFGPVPGDKHLARHFRHCGWKTVLAGVQHETFHGGERELGYDEILEAEAESDGERTQDRGMATALAGRIRGHGGDQPLFVWFGTQYPHRPFPKPSEDAGYLQPPFPVSDTPEGRLDFAGYRAAVAIADHCFGEMIQAIQDRGILEESIIVVTTDHGPAFPEMKCTLKDSGIGVALMIAAAGRASGCVSDSLVSHLDVFPTLCELTGLPTPEWSQGRSLVPILQNPNGEIRSEIFAEVTYHAAYEPMRCIRTKRHKLICRFDPDRLLPVLANVDNGPERERLLANGWERQQRSLLEFYDLALDPYETTNLADNPASASIIAELSRRLDEWMRQTNDPLHTNLPRVPAPSGAKVNALASRDSTDDILEATDELP